ncbi:S-layer homology domain-containing protein [Falsibacillus albus]|nr:S-layer homology domain-containing protein [Falsibacillus albus]
MKKAVFTVIAFLLVVSTYLPSAVSAKTALGEELQAVIDMGIMQGNENGDYMPKKNVTRGEFATFISRALKLPAGTGSFKDVASGSKLAPGIYAASKAGIVTGYTDGRFGPNDTISREQMAVMIGRALNYKNVEQTTEPISFSDSSQLPSSVKKAVMVNVHYKIINGIPNSDGTFRFEPKSNATREQAAAVIYRMLNAVSGQYQLATVQNGELKLTGKSYKTFTDAKIAMNDASDVMLVNGQVFKVTSGIAVPTGMAIVYSEDMKSQITYVTDQAELKYVDADENKVKIEIAGKTGYVKHDSVKLVPSQMKKDESYYEVSGGQLYHHFYKPLSGAKDTAIVGKAPSFMASGAKYYSQDGYTYMDASGTVAGKGYQYFDVLPLRTATNYTAEELNQYVSQVKPDSPLANLGEEFKKAEQKYRVNALFMLSHAIIESDYGTSRIAVDKHNIFGIGAHDENPYEHASYYDSFEDCIDQYASMINADYINPTSTYALGAILGNKARGLNVQYSGDVYWGEKIAGVMYSIDAALGKKDFGQYQVAESVTDFINVRKSPNTELAAQFTYHYRGAPFVILDEIQESDGIWYKTLSDSIDYTTAYIRSDNTKLLPIIK